MTTALLLIATLLVALNIKATLALAKSSRYEKKQKQLQVALIWFVPFIGSLLVLSLVNDSPGTRVTTDLADRGAAADGHKIPDGIGHGIGHD